MSVCSSCAHNNVGTSLLCDDCGGKLVNPAKAEREADEIDASFMLNRVKNAKNALSLVAGVQITRLVVSQKTILGRAGGPKHSLSGNPAEAIRNLGTRSGREGGV